MERLNNKGKVCVLAFWTMAIAFVASLTCCLVGHYKAMYLWAMLLGIAAVVFLILSPQKYVDPKGRLFRKH